MRAVLKLYHELKGGGGITDSADIERVIRRYHKQLRADKFENLGKINS